MVVDCCFVLHQTSQVLDVGLQQHLDNEFEGRKRIPPEKENTSKKKGEGGAFSEILIEWSTL